MKKYFWILGNVYGKIFGRQWMAPFHHAVANISLHALGYDNMLYESWTGETWFLKKILAPTKPKIIFDIGANVGNYSRMLEQHTDASVYAFEPNTSSFNKLSLLSERITKINSAVSNFNGEATLYFSQDYDGCASLDTNIRKGNEIQVQVRTVESFVKEFELENIDYIKIDVEGFEKEVIEGLGRVRPKFIQFEFNLHHLYKSCTVLDITQSLPEYTLYRLLPNGWIKIDPKKYLSNIFMFSNIVAVKD